MGERKLSQLRVGMYDLGGTALVFFSGCLAFSKMKVSNKLTRKTLNTCSEY